MAIGPFWAEIQQITYLTLKNQGQVMAKVKADGHIWSLEFNRYVCFLFCGNRTIGPFFAEIKQIQCLTSRSWPRSNSMVTFEAQISIDMFAFCFVAIGPFLAQIEQIPCLTLKILGQDHNENHPKCNQIIYRSGPTIVPKMKEIQKVVKKLSHDKICGRRQRRWREWRGRRRMNRYKNIKSAPVYRGDLNSLCEISFMTRFNQYRCQCFTVRWKFGLLNSMQ